MAMNKQRKTGNILNIVSYDTSGNVTLPAALAAGTIHNTGYTQFLKPLGGSYVIQASLVTGAIAVSLPVGMTDSMLRVTIKIYEYTTNESFEVHAGGYTYSTGNTWANNPFAYIIGNPGIDRRFNVRFGYNGTTGKAVIYIGELASTWSYPQVHITEMQVGYAGMTAAWVNACAIGFETTAFQNVTATISNAQVGYAVSTNTANAVVLRDGSGNFSAGTITATNVTVNGNQVLHAGNYNTYALPLTGGTLTGTLTISTGTDGALTLRVPSADPTQWNYINFTGTDGVRDAYFGTDSAGNPVWNREDNSLNITLGTVATVNGVQIVTNTGTWGISITGSAATSTTQANSDNSANIATTAYVKSLFGAQSTGGVLDWNDISNIRPGSGPTLLLASATNGFAGGGVYYHPFNFEYSSKNGTGNITQLAIAYGSPGNDIKMRGRYDGVWASWVTFLNSGNYNSYSPTLTGGGASGNWSINAATATNLSTDRSSWVTNGTITAVVGQLGWRHYGNGHTIFDASNSLSPTGTTVSNTNSEIQWSGQYPTLMGWNGSQTYGVRVDTARYAESSGNASTVGGVSASKIVHGDTGSRRGVNLISDWNQATFPDAAFLSSEASSTNAPSTDYLYGVQMSFHRSGPDYRSQFVTSLYGNNVYYLRTRRDTAGWTSWVTLIHSSNYNSFAPTLTGGGASGNWAINVTGTAGSETLATVTGRGATTATAVQFTAGTSSTSTTTGTVRVTGGVGITGNLYSGGNVVAVAFFESSDIRLKTVLETNPDKTVDVDVIKFERNDQPGIRYGYSAQDVQKIAPELVAGDQFLSVNYLDIHTLKIAALEKEIRELKAKLEN